MGFSTYGVQKRYSRRAWRLTSPVIQTSCSGKLADVIFSVGLLRCFYASLEDVMP